MSDNISLNVWYNVECFRQIRTVKKTHIPFAVTFFFPLQPFHLR